VSPVRITDLPSKVRRRVRSVGDGPGGGRVDGTPTAPPTTLAVRGSAGGCCRWRCHQCGEVLEAVDSGAPTADPFKKVERHRHPSGVMGGLVGRLELVLR
jgi:hypothetical protein